MGSEYRDCQIIKHALQKQVEFRKINGPEKDLKAEEELLRHYTEKVNRLKEKYCIKDRTV